MRLTDKYFGRFFALSLSCGLMLFLAVAAIWYAISEVSWFDCYWIAAVIAGNWGVGGVAGWLITPARKANMLWLRTYFMCVAVFFIGAILFGGWDPSVSGWTVMFMIGFTIFSFPFAIILGLLANRLISSNSER